MACPITIGLKNCQKLNMQNQQRYIRLALTAVGLWTVLLSFTVMFPAIQHGALQDDAVSDISIAVLLLGVFLALGGGCLALRGMKYRDRAA
jgi:hypothetical protein